MAISFMVSQDTMLYVENISNISFISFFPIKNFYDKETITQEQKAQNSKDLENMINVLGAYDPGSLNSKSTGGTVYKILSLNIAKSNLQKYQLTKYKNNFNSIFGKEELNLDYFNFEKEKFMISSILKENTYDMVNYLSIKTHLGLEEITKIFGKNCFNDFKNFTPEVFERYKDKISLFLKTHYKNIDFEYLERKKINTDIFLELLAKLNLTYSTTGVNEYNFHNIQEDKIKTPNSIQINIKENNFDKLFTYIIIDTAYIILNSNKTNYQDIYIPIFKGEYVEYSHTKEGGFIVQIVSDTQIKTIYECLKYVDIEIGKEKRFYYPYVLSEVPLVFDSNKPIFNIINKTLRKNCFRDFVLGLEIIKIPTKRTISNINNIMNAFLAISQTPSFGGFSYNKKEVEDKIQSLESMLHHINDGKSFVKIRLTINFFTNRPIELSDMNHLLKQEFIKEDLFWTPLKYNLQDLCKPYIKTNLINIEEYAYNISSIEVARMIDLYNGNSYLNNKDDTNLDDLKIIDNSDIYTKSAEKIQGINMFESNDMFNGVIIAPSGAGKSFTTCHLIDGFTSGEINKENICMIIDRGGSYTNFTSVSNGINISINKTDSTNCINPFIFSNYFAKLLKLELILNDCKLIEKNFIGNEDFAIKQLQLDYEKLQEEMEEILSTCTDIEGYLQDDDSIIRNNKGYIIDTLFKGSAMQDVMEIWIGLVLDMIGEDTISKENQGAVSRNLYKVFQGMISEMADLNKSNDEVLYLLLEDISQELRTSILLDEQESFDEETLNKYLFQLEEYINPLQSGKLFNSAPTLDFSKTKLSNIDFGEIQNEKLSNLVLVSLVLQFFNIMTSKVYKSSKKLLVIDEAHAVLNSNYTSGLKSVSYLYRTARKHGAAVLLLSQAINDFVKVPGETDPLKMSQFSGIIGNCGIKWLLGRHPKSECINRLDLPEHIANTISTNSSRRFFTISKILNFSELIVSEMTYAISTTNKEEKIIISVLKNFTGSSQGSLLIFSYLFGMGFLSKFSNTKNFLIEFGIDFNYPPNKKKLDSLFNYYYDGLEKDKKEKLIEQNTIFSNDFDKNLLIGLLTYTELSDLRLKVKEIIEKI